MVEIKNFDIGMNDQNIIERITFPCGEVKLKGKVCRPKDMTHCKGIVIFTHGLGYCARQYEIKGEYFVQNGYLLCTYNLRGHAGTSGNWTIENSVNDLSFLIDYLEENYKFANNQRICVIGHSTGALITLLASLKDKRIKFGSAVTTVTCLRDSYLHWFKSGFNIDAQEFFKSKGHIDPVIKKFLDDDVMYKQFCEKKIDLDELKVSHRYGLLKSNSWGDFFHEIAFSKDIFDYIDNITIPLLLFRGEYDEVMDVKKTNELYENLNEKIPCKLYVTGSQNHFHNDRWTMIQSETLKFFDEYCTYQANEDPADKFILLIDDDQLVRRTIESLLKKNGFCHVELAENGFEALAKIVELKEKKERDFDLIISDIRMPDIDGVETIKRAKKIISESKGKQSPVIFITGYEGDRAKAREEVGYVDYFNKPFDANLFLESVRRQVGCSKK